MYYSVAHFNYLAVYIIDMLSLQEKPPKAVHKTTLRWTVILRFDSSEMKSLLLRPNEKLAIILK